MLNILALPETSRKMPRFGVTFVNLPGLAGKDLAPAGFRPRRPSRGLQSAGEYGSFCFIIKEFDNPKGYRMTEIDSEAFASDAELEASVRPLVNEILDRFNQANVSPSQAGMIILGLIYRLLEVMCEAPEARRFFILTLINLVNNYLAEEMEAGGECPASHQE